MMEIYLDEISEPIPDEFEKYFKFIENVGSGSFGTVVKAVNLENNNLIAVKSVNKFGAKGKPKDINKLKKEITILKQLKHKNIVEFYGFIETNQKIYIMMEYIHNGTLRNLLEKRKYKNFTEEEASKMLECLFSAVEYLHSREICHRDIKPENIMFENSNDMATLKLVDFGLSSQYFEAMENYEFCGTLIYMAPEQIESKIYTKSIDIWSCGIIMYMLLNNGVHPIYKKGDKYNEYLQKLKKPIISFQNKLSRMAKLLLVKLLEPDPIKRYSADRALSHPWITKKIHSNIPKTYLESMEANEVRRKILHVFGAGLFILNYKKESLTNIKDNPQEISTSTNNKEVEYISRTLQLNNPDNKNNEGKKFPVTSNNEFSSALFDDKNLNFLEYSEKVDNLSERLKLKFIKLREKCIDPCLSEEFEAFKNEIYNSFDNNPLIKRRNSKKKPSNGVEIKRHSKNEINPFNNNQQLKQLITNPTMDSVTTRKRSLKLRKNTLTLNKQLNEDIEGVDKINKSHNRNSVYNTLSVRKSRDSKLSQNVKPGVSIRLRSNINEGELIKKIEKSLKNTGIDSVRRTMKIANNQNPFKDKNVENKNNVTNTLTQGNIESKSRDKKNNLITTSTYKTNEETKVNSENNLLMKSIRKEKNNEANRENIQERIVDNSGSFNNCLTLEKSDNISKRFLHIKSANKSGTSLRKENKSEKSNTKIFSKDPKQIYLYHTKENETHVDQLGKSIKINANNITGLKRSSNPIVERNINFVRVDLPLILPNLSSQNNSNSNTNIFRNNKIRKSSNKKI